MVRRSRVMRMLVLGWAALQFALPAALSVLDAVESGRSERGAFAHVEDASRQSCQAPHSEECALCRFLTGSSSNDARTVGGIGPTARSALVSCAAPVAVARASLDAVRSRAPPPV